MNQQDLILVFQTGNVDFGLVPRCCIQHWRVAKQINAQCNSSWASSATPVWNIYIATTKAVDGMYILSAEISQGSPCIPVVSALNTAIRDPCSEYSPIEVLLVDFSSLLSIYCELKVPS